MPNSQIIWTFSASLYLVILKTKNVWMSDKSWEPESFLMFSYVFQCFLTLSLSITLSPSLSLLLTLTLFQSLIQSLSTCWTIFVFMSRLKSRCLLPKIAMLFFDIITIVVSSSTLSCDFWVHRAGSQLKMIINNSILIGDHVIWHNLPRSSKLRNNKVDQPCNSSFPKLLNITECCDPAGMPLLF